MHLQSQKHLQTLHSKVGKKWYLHNSTLRSSVQKVAEERGCTILLVGMVDIEQCEVVTINVCKASLSFIRSFLSIPWAKEAIGNYYIWIWEPHEFYVCNRFFITGWGKQHHGRSADAESADSRRKWCTLRWLCNTALHSINIITAIGI